MFAELAPQPAYRPLGPLRPPPPPGAAEQRLGRLPYIQGCPHVYQSVQLTIKKRSYVLKVGKWFFGLRHDYT
ncbi:MAG: hypothetical protein AAFZ15_13615 [Bacteroidota bacterium]